MKSCLRQQYTHKEWMGELSSVKWADACFTQNKNASTLVKKGKRLL